MKAATCFSGIGAPEIAGPEYDWVWHAEIEKFPSAVMRARHPESVNLGDVLAPDFIDRAKELGPLNLMAGGPPCQAFSFAGLRGSLGDARGNLTLRWVQILHAIRPLNAITENVPGWLSTDDNAFGCFLGAIVGSDAPLLPPGGGGWPRVGMVAGPLGRSAWRVFDAQYFGLAQRRERVFVVSDFGEGADPAAVLFERQSLSGNHPPRREAGQGTAPTLSARTKGGGGLGTDFELDGGLIPDVPSFVADVAGTLPAGGNSTGGDRPPGMGQETADSFLVAHTLRGEGFDASEDGTGRGIPLVGEYVPIISSALKSRDYKGPSSDGDGDGAPLVASYAIQAGALRENPESGPDGIGVQADLAYTVEARAEVQAVAFSCKDSGNDATSDLAPTLRSMNNANGNANAGGQMAVAYGLSPDTFDRDGEGAGGLAAERSGLGVEEELAYALRAKRAGGVTVAGEDSTQWAVRRLTALECERLQGFPESYTLIEYGSRRSVEEDEAEYLRAQGAVVDLANDGKLRTNFAADGPRYKALGNSWAKNCGRWIIARIVKFQNAGISQ